MGIAIANRKNRCDFGGLSFSTGREAREPLSIFLLLGGFMPENTKYQMITLRLRQARAAEETIANAHV